MDGKADAVPLYHKGMANVRNVGSLAHSLLRPRNPLRKLLWQTVAGSLREELLERSGRAASFHRDRPIQVDRHQAALGALRAAFHRRHFDQRRGGMCKAKGLDHMRRNRDEHIPVGIRNLLVQTDPHEFETIGPVAQKQGAAISDSCGAINFVV